MSIVYTTQKVYTIIVKGDNPKTKRAARATGRQEGGKHEHGETSQRRMVRQWQGIRKPDRRSQGDLAQVRQAGAGETRPHQKPASGDSIADLGEKFKEVFENGQTGIDSTGRTAKNSPV